LKLFGFYAEIGACIEPGPHNPAVSWLNCNHYSGKNALKPGTFCEGHGRGAAKVRQDLMKVFHTINHVQFNEKILLIAMAVILIFILIFGGFKF